VSNLLIFAERVDWHTRSLLAAIAAQGRTAQVVSLRACGFAVGGTAHGLLLPGFGDDLPAACFVRSVPNGTLEQVTLRLSVLHALRELGVPVMNDARAIERCVDKSATTFLLAHAGLPTPRTLVLEDRTDAQMLVDSAPGDSVLKPMFGAQGRGLARLPRGTALPAAEEVGSVYYLQDFVRAPHETTGADDPGDILHEDFRVFVVGGVAVAAMARRCTSWITNIHQGATGVPVAAEGILADLAVRAAAAVGADYAGVDIISGADDRLLVLEVNSMPAWRGLYDATGRNMAEPLAAHLCAARKVPA
jgi:RimK family alpha-L-glutamate ligase